MTEILASNKRDLDATADLHVVDPRLATDLFAMIGVIATEPALRRTLTDPANPPGAVKGLIDGVFGEHVGEAAREVLQAASELRWGAGSSFIAALERQAVRNVVARADAAGRLDELEADLFAVERLVAANPDLREALADRSKPLAARAELLGGLLADRVTPEARTLAERAVAAHKRTFDLTIEEYLQIAAEQRRRGIAEVRVAHPLTAEQTARLRAALISQVGRDLTMHVTVDPTILGGAEVRIGDEAITGSVAGRLEAARRAFA